MSRRRNPLATRGKHHRPSRRAHAKSTALAVRTPAGPTLAQRLRRHRQALRTWWANRDPYRGDWHNDDQDGTETLVILCYQGPGPTWQPPSYALPAALQDVDTPSLYADRERFGKWLDDRYVTLILERGRP